MVRMPRTLRRPVLATFVLFGLSGCGERPPVYPAVRPLLDGLHEPDLLTEGGTLEPPPSLSGNRFLAGWTGWRDDGGRVVLSPSPGGARVEIVRLAAAERRLILDLRDGDPIDPIGGAVRVRAADRDLGTFSWRDPLEIPLPADLPLGRVAIDLVPEGFPSGEGSPSGVVGAALRPALPAGKLAVEGRDLVQGGASRAEVAVRITDETDLVGTFVPPEHPEPGQLWRIAVERPD